MTCPEGAFGVTDPTSIPAGTDDRCNPTTAAGWVNIMVTYDGKAFVMYLDGQEAGRTEWEDSKYPKPNPYRHPLSIGYGFQGFVDQVVLMKSVVSPEALQMNFAYCPVPISEIADVGAVAYMPFSEGSGPTTLLYRGDGSSSEGILDLGGMVLTNVPRDGDYQRVLWGPNFAPSLLGLNPDMAHSEFEDLEEEKIAGEPFQFQLIVNDQCGFRYWNSDLTSRLSTDGPSLLSWADFAPTCEDYEHQFDVFSGWAYGDPSPSPTTIGYNWQKSSPVCGMGPVLGTITSTVSGWFGLKLQGITSDPVIDHPLLVKPAAISAASTVDTANAVTSAPAGALVAMTFYARDEFGNRLTTGGDADKVTFFSDDDSFIFKMLHDNEDGTYLLVFVGDRATASLPVNWSVNGTASPSGFTIAIDKPGLTEVVVAEDSPGQLYGAAAATLGHDWYMFGGVKGDRMYSDKLYKFDKDHSGFYLHYTDVKLPSGTAEIVRIQLDTTDPRIKADCSDIRFTMPGTNASLPFILMPVPGCKSVNSTFLIRGAVDIVRMHFGNALAETGYEPEDVFDITDNFDAEDCTDSAYFGEISRALMPGESVTVPLSLPSEFYLHFAFYDQAANPEAGVQMLTVTGADNETISFGIDTVMRNNFYKEKYIYMDSENTDLPLTIGNSRSEGWHFVEIIHYSDKLLGVFVDGIGVRDIPNVTITPVSLTVSNSDGPEETPMLWNALWAVGGQPGQDVPALVRPEEPVSILFSGDIHYSHDGEWKVVAEDSYRPPARKGHSMVTVDDRMFLFGGERAANALNDVWSYSAEEDKWAFHGVMSIPAGSPSPRYQASMVEYNGKLYVYGGKASGFGEVFSDLWEFDPEYNEWCDLTARYSQFGDTWAATDLNRYGHTAVQYDGVMYVFGGHNGVDLAPVNVIALDLETLVWTMIEPIMAAGQSLPLRRMAHIAVLDDDVMYMFGGSEGATEYNEFGDVWAYEIKTNTWFRMIQRIVLPQAEALATMYESAAAVVDGHMLIYGGRGGGDVSPILFAVPAGRGSISTFKK